MIRFIAVAILCLVSLAARGGTIATFKTTVGTWDLELFDETKPITVSNFLKYVTSGRYANQLIHRWVPGFVIQGGAFRVDTTNPQQYEIVQIPTFGNITNEAQVNTNYSNVYGTIAMARVGGQTNSASSQWFINLKDNGGSPAFLDTADGGFTVFGRIISATNVLNLFVPEPPANRIYIDNSILGSPMAVIATNDIGYEDLVYVQISARRDFDLEITRTISGLRQLEWTSVAGLTNFVEYTTNYTNWLTHAALLGTGDRMQTMDRSSDSGRVYRVKVLY
jgi:cyclophilin family peptidyl-prolyl cis-trans isomerase